MEIKENDRIIYVYTDHNTGVSWELFANDILAADAIYLEHTKIDVRKAPHIGCEIKIDTDLDDIHCDVNYSGVKYWRILETLAVHRDDDLPAVIQPDGTRAWYQHGKLHRDNDLPAVEYLDGTREWWINNQLIRIIDEDGICYE